MDDQDDLATFQDLYAETMVKLRLQTEQAEHSQHEAERLGDMLKEVRGELEISDHNTNRMSELLTQTANALKGPPPDLVWHDWSDLPAVATELATKHRNVVEMLNAATVAWMAEREGLETDLAAAKAALLYAEQRASKVQHDRAEAVRERSEAQADASRLRECRDTWKAQAESLQARAQAAEDLLVRTQALIGESESS